MQDELTPSWFIGVDWTGAETHRRAFAERFKLITPIGRGGSAEVWKALDPVDDSEVAIKVLVHEVARSARFQTLLRNEVRAVARLSHPNLVRMLDVGTLGPEVELSTEGRLVAGSPFLAMELLRGGSLLPLTVRPRAWPVLQSILETLLDALAHAHARGVVHLDIKPSNVMRRSEDDTDVALTDFGIAWIARDPVPIGSGTPAYAAPEQLIGDGRDVGPVTDLFALGCLAWELITGRPPFDDADPHARAFATPGQLEARMAVPPHVEPWLRRLLDPAPRRRFESAYAARCALHSSRAVDITQERSPRSFGYGLGLCELNAVPFVGRRREREQLWSWIDDAIRTGEGSEIEIAGPPGSGRTRLADWLTTRVREIDAASVLSLTNQLGGSLSDALQRHFRTSSLSAPRIASRLEDVVGAHWVVAAASEVLAGASDDPTALHDLVALMARHRPVVLVCEGSAPPIKSTIRIVIKEHTKDGIALKPFSDAERDELLNVLRLEPEPREILRALVAWPGGLLSAVGHWMESGKLERRDGRMALSSRPGPISAVWEERLNGLARRLNEAEVRALEVAAVLGSGCEIRLWQCAAKHAGTFPTLAAVDRMAMEALCELREDRVSFLDTRVADALVRRSSEGGRLRAQHSACAIAIAEVGVRAAEERRGSHLHHAGEHADAIPLLITAAAARLNALDPSRAATLVRLADRSLQSLSTRPPELVVRTTLLRSRVERRLGNIDTAAALAKQAHRGARAHGSALLRADAAHQRGRVARAQGDTTRAMRYLLEAREAAREIDYATRIADILIDMANVLRGQGADDRASRLAEEAIKLDPRPKGRAMARVLASRLARRRGDLAAAEAQLEDAMLELEQHRPRLLPEVWGEAGELARTRGEHARAAAWYRKALAGFVELGTVSRAPSIELKLGLTLIELNDIEAADGCIRGALGAWKAAGRSDLVDGWQLALAWISARTDRWDSCDAILLQTTRLEDEDWLGLLRRFQLAARDRSDLLVRLKSLQTAHSNRETRIDT